MIEAWFQVGSFVVACKIPDRTMMQHAEMAGMDPRDLFTIDIPAGATRETRVKCLINRADVTRLYQGATAQGQGSAVFNWRENSAATTQSITLFLLPPKPVYIQADGGAGVVLVEAVDARYWWKRTYYANWSNLNLYPVVAKRFTGNARESEEYDASAIVTTLRNLLPVGTIDLAELTTYSGEYSESRITRMFNGATSLAMLIDLFLASMGFCVMWDPDSASVYRAKRILSDPVAVNGMMSDYKRAVCGGFEPNSGEFAPSDSLLDWWDSTNQSMRNRSSATVSVHMPFRAPEGFTTYNSTLSVINQGVPFDLSRESGEWENLPFNGQRFRQGIGSMNLIESFPMTAKNNSVAPDPANAIDSAITSSGIGYTGWQAEVQQYADQLDRRQKVFFGKTVWAGWLKTVVDPFRATMLRYTVGRNPNRTSSDDYTLVPYTYTEAREDDWILGPSGDLPTDPTMIAVGNGTIHAQRLSSGELWIDSAPPMCRIFPARILGSERIGTSGNDYWRWTYAWQEVEPNCGAGYTTSTPTTAMAGYERTSAASGVARNFAEQGNKYVGSQNPANVIATGAVQADYLPTAEIEPYPICEDTIVLMVEQNSSVKIEGGSATRFWFSIPNAIKTTCLQQPEFGANLDGGVYDGGED